MAVTTSALWDVITQLLVIFRANATLTANNVLVIDGPITTNDAIVNTLLVGGTADDEQGDQDHAEFTQAWGELGARARYEDLNVICQLWVNDGGTDLAARRATAKTILAAVETDLRTNFTINVANLLWAHVTSAQLGQIQTEQGSAVRVTFTITARARLASQ